MTTSKGFLHKTSASFIEITERTVRRRYFNGLTDEQRDRLREQLDVFHHLLSGQRAARIAFLGTMETPLSAILGPIAGLTQSSENRIKEKLGRKRWYTYHTPCGSVRVLDGRLASQESRDVPLKALGREKPDVVVIVCTYDEFLEDDFLDYVESFFLEIRSQYVDAPSMVLMLSSGSPRSPKPVFERLHTTAVPRSAWQLIYSRNQSNFVRQTIQKTPTDVRYHLARMSPDLGAKRDIADQLIGACSSITGVVATVPLPVADIVPITSMQMAMVASIAHLSGRDWNLKTASEFMLALGLNVGAGFAFREVVRAAAQFVPVAGTALSAGITTTATYALGRAAVAYFIDGEPLEHLSDAQTRAGMPDSPTIS